MALWRARALAPSPPDALTEALCAAEFGEDCDVTSLGGDALRELFASLPQLRVSVPFATVRLLARLATDARIDVRAQTARALSWFVDLYPQRVEELLLLLSCDGSRKVRQAAAEALAALLPTVPDPWKLIAAWENEHPDRARAALQSARRALPPPLGV